MILVTGASGMLGSRLVQRLSRAGERVRALVRTPRTALATLPGVECVTGDVLDPHSLAAAMTGCSHVFHTAAVVSYRRRDAERAYRTHVLGTRNVMRAALDAGVQRAVHTSSTAAVGLREEPVVIDEGEIFEERFRRVPYMWTKHLAEIEVAEAVASGLDAVVVNPTTLVGPGDRNLNAGQVFARIARGSITFAPPGGNSFVGLDDAVSGLLLAMERGRTGRRYVLSAGNLSHRDWLSGIARELGRPPVERLLPEWTEVPLTAIAAIADRFGADLTPSVVFFTYRYRWFTAQRAEEELGWKPRQSFEEAVREAAAWYAGAGLLPQIAPRKLTSGANRRQMEGA